MHARKAPPSSLAALHSRLVPRTSLHRAMVVDALADRGSSQRGIGSMPPSLRDGVGAERRCLVAGYRCQDAAPGANGKARA